MIAFGAIRKVLRWAIVTQRASGLAGTKQFRTSVGGGPGRAVRRAAATCSALSCRGIAHPVLRALQAAQRRRLR